ncbi:MAG: hypothetical protein A2W90_05115 [Bacteroidetes bacterium GWF2_42_66]|nr:MAG: hypothetical protein A2W92_03290 [Bacteroidetes bacterium GWA2_42_15]OFX95964.1 MAG: hypothetical protein A2W89_02525 [Bacteroidetes bacterium GWE2_42_39]OFY46537.1 MAG: hypothetical protein A2W90_05115 [Bacteroidetes bacterium GWF2_42_66]HCR91017.1 glycoside hydrolase family 1 [Prolixibacteraceae bacterium]
MLLARSLFFVAVIFSLSAFNRLNAQENNCSYLIWADEFDTGNAPSSAKWDYDTGGGGWGNNELQTYTNTRTNSWVENGRLYIKALKTAGNWTSARMVTRQKGDWLYGRIEVKAKLPSGKGTWPAIWMLPTDWEYGSWPKSGEIDIMEHVGYDPGKIHGTAHTEAYNHSVGTQKGNNITVSDALSVFHVYAIEWNAEQIKWYVDDQLYFTFNNEYKTYKEWPFDKRFHLLLNIAVGGNWGGAQGIDPNLTEATMEIEYVRVYQNKLAKPVIEGKNVAKPGSELVFSTKAINNVVYEWTFPEGVEVISGQNTPQIKVKWGTVGGNVKVRIRSACETIDSEEFPVGLITTPTGSKFYIPFFSNQGAVLWTSQPGSGNQISLSGSASLLVNYSISEPANNPAIVYEFDGLMDLSGYREMALQIKANPADVPSVVRIDMEDANGNVNLNDLFKITSFGNAGQFQLYSYEFGKNPDGVYRLGEIKKIKIYINYGIFGKKGNSSIELKDLYLATPGTTSAKSNLQKPEFQVYPNPFTDEIRFSGNSLPEEVTVFNSLGQKIFQEKMNGSSRLNLSPSLPGGVYFIQLSGENGTFFVHRLIKR